MNLKLITRELGKNIKRNSPSILTGLGVAGFVTSVAMAIRATPRALEILHHEEEFRQREVNDPEYLVYLTTQDKIRLAGPCYLPTLGMMGLSATMIIMANQINLRRNAALASVYAIAESGLRDYQEKVVEQLGKTKEEKVRGEVAQKKLDENPVRDGQVLMIRDGKQLCYDTFSGRYFMSDIETLRQIQNEFNARLLNEMTLTLNELYYDIGLPSIDGGKDVGWVVEKGLLELEFFAKIASDNQPCIVVGYNNGPRAVQF